MSGEFGSHTSGYFWWQIETAAQDCLQGGGEITRLWGKFLEEFAPVAYGISWFEAGDSSVARPIRETMAKIEALRAAFRAIEKYVEPFQRIADDAVRAAAPDEVGRS